MKTCTVIAGVSGCGKSSFIGVLISQCPDIGPVIDTEELAAEKGGTRQETIKDSTSLQERLLREGVTHAVETTLRGKREKNMIRQAKRSGYFVRMAYIGVSGMRECLTRIEKRVAKGGHNVPDEEVYWQHKKRWEDLSEVINYCNEVRFFDNENGFVEIAEYANGELISKGNYRPGWLLELVEILEK